MGRMSIQLTSYQLWIRPGEYPTAEMYSSLPKKPQNIMDANKENDRITNLLLWDWVPCVTVVFCCRKNNNTNYLHPLYQPIYELTNIFTVSLTFCIKVRYNMHYSVVVVATHCLERMVFYVAACKIYLLTSCWSLNDKWWDSLQEAHSLPVHCIMRPPSTISSTKYCLQTVDHTICKTSSDQICDSLTHCFYSMAVCCKKWPCDLHLFHPISDGTLTLHARNYDPPYINLNVSYLKICVTCNKRHLHIFQPILLFCF